MSEIKACAVSEKRSPDGYRDEFLRNKRNAEIGHYGQTLSIFLLEKRTATERYVEAA
jgi:hypothetical protein